MVLWLWYIKCVGADAFLSPCARGVFGNSSPDGTRRAAASRSAGLSMAWLRSWWTRGPISALGHLTPCGRITQIAVSSSKLDPIAARFDFHKFLRARTRRRLAKLPNYANILCQPRETRTATCKSTRGPATWLRVRCVVYFRIVQPAFVGDFHWGERWDGIELLLGVRFSCGFVDT